MPLVSGKCPLCGANIQVPDDVDECHCSSCGEKIIASAAIAFAADRPKSIASDGSASANPANIAASPEGGGVPLQRKTHPTPSRPEPPFLKEWRTNGVLVFFGIILSSLINSVLTELSNVVTTYSAFYVVMMMSIALCVTSAIYALAVYPTLFGDSPLMKSRNGVSFLNGLFGGIIFGPLFTHYLTKGEKTDWYMVLGAVEIIGAVAGLAIALSV